VNISQPKLRSEKFDNSDITIRDNKQATCMLIDVALPEDRNVIKKEAEKFPIYI